MLTATELIPNTDTPTVLVSLKTELTIEPRAGEFTVSSTDLEAAQGRRCRAIERGIPNPFLAGNGNTASQFITIVRNLIHT